MTVKWEKLEKNEGQITVEVDKEKVNAALDQAFKKVVKQVNVPGFRKGRVPRKIFEARFGVESLYQDALDMLLPSAYEEAVNEAGINPVDQPRDLDIDQMEKGKELIFTAKVTVKPEVELGEYKGIEVPEKDFTVTDEAVEEELKKAQERQAELVVVEEDDHAVEEGETAVIDFEGFIDGEAFDGGKGENYSLEIGSGSFIPGFEEQVVGMKKGEEKDVSVTFPEDYQADHLQGKEATFKVTLKDIKQKIVPELDDEFAKDVSEFETLAEYKEDIRKKLEEQAENEEERYIRETAVEIAAENAQIDIPDVMIDHESDHMLQEFEQRLAGQGMTADMYYQMMGTDKETMKDQLKEDAAKRVRINLTLEAIAHQEELTVSEEEVEEEIGRMAEMYDREKDEIKQLLQAQGNLNGLEEDLKIRKAVDLIVNNSKQAA